MVTLSMARQVKWVINCWLAAALLLSAVALYWLPIWLVPPGNPRNSTLRLAYERINSTMTLSTAEAIVGRPPGNSPRPAGMKMTEDQAALYVAELPESDTTIWRDEDQSLVAYYSMESDRRFLGKRFYIALDLSEYDGTGGWHRIGKWFHKLFR
jgi:hypothetical protein